MDLALYQLIIVALALIMIFQGIRTYVSRAQGQTFLKLAVRLVVWGGMIIIVGFPEASSFITRLLGIENNINAVILAGFLLVFLMAFKLLSTIERLEQQISQVVRDQTLSELKKNKDP